MRNTDHRILINYRFNIWNGGVLMKNLKVKAKFIILIIITCAIMVALSISTIIIITSLKNQSVNMLKSSIQTEYDAGIRQEVNTAIAICN